MNEESRRSQNERAKRSPEHASSKAATGAEAERRRRAAAKRAAMRRKKARKRRNRRIAIAAGAVIVVALVLTLALRGGEDVPKSEGTPVQTVAATQTPDVSPSPTVEPQTTEEVCAERIEPEASETPEATQEPAQEVDFSAYTAGGVRLTGAAASSTKPYRIYVSKNSYTIAILGADESGEYTRLLKTFRTAIGTGNKTRAGSYEIDKKYDWYDWALGGYTPFTCRLGGSKIRLHAPLHNKDEDWNSLYREGYREIGTKATQGCLRTTCQGAAWVYFNCDLGTEVVIANDALYESEDPPALGDSHSDPTRPTSLDDLEIPVTFFALSAQSIELAVDETTAIVPENVLPMFEGNRNFVYVSGDESVAKVDENGNVTAVGAGTTSVLVMANDVNRAYRVVTVTVGAQV